MNRSKQKGTAWESAIVDYLHECGFGDVERRALAGTLDKGDVAGLRGIVIEAKNVGEYDIPGFLRETETERENAGAWLGVCWMKLRGKGRPADAAVIMSGRQFANLLDQLYRTRLLP